MGLGKPHGTRPRRRRCAGTGTGTLALARQLPDAEVIALDVDEEMLKRIQDKARASGLADRIRTVQADLDQAWPDGLQAADLVSAANSMHHMGDPARAVAQIYQMLRPGGLLAVTELESFPRFLTDPAGAAPEERIHTAMARGRDKAGMPCMRTGLPVSPKPGSRSSPNAAS